LQTKKKYFASDFHLGYPNKEDSREREIKLVHWLDSIKHDAEEIYLMGDIFDFWYEYKWVVPRGFVRFIGKLAELTDSGIPIYLFRGNHDIWLDDYLPKEAGVILLEQPVIREWNGKRFFLYHGHALGRYDRGMNFLNWVFTNRFLQFLFSRIHPNGAFAFAHFWSKKSREAKVYEAKTFLSEDKEVLFLYTKEVLQKEHYDYFVFGHRHLALNVAIGNNSHIINLGNWISRSTYGVWDGETFALKEF
jgi:UDP-2,3-diacylglucosamine hydrolase